MMKAVSPGRPVDGGRLPANWRVRRRGGEISLPADHDVAPAGQGRKRGGSDSQVLRPMITVWPVVSALKSGHVRSGMFQISGCPADDPVFGDGGDDDDFRHGDHVGMGEGVAVQRDVVGGRLLPRKSRRMPFCWIRCHRRLSCQAWQARSRATHSACGCRRRAPAVVGGLVVQRVALLTSTTVSTACCRRWRGRWRRCRSAGCTSGSGRRLEARASRSSRPGLDARWAKYSPRRTDPDGDLHRGSARPVRGNLPPWRFVASCCGFQHRQLRRQVRQPSPTVSSRSRPFWWVRRLMTPNSGRSAQSSISNPISPCSAVLFALGGQLVGGVGSAASAGSVAGFQMPVSTPFRMPRRSPARWRPRQQGCEAVAEMFVLDFAGIGRADGGQLRGQLQAGF